MMPLSLGAIALGAVALLLCRPWLESDRSPMTIPLGLGIAFGWLLRQPRAGIEPITWFEPLWALAAGWLVLAAAEAWDVTALRTRWPARLWAAACLPMILAPAATLAADLATARLFAATPFVCLACAAIALDPQVAHHRLGAARRPTPTDRAAPGRASLLLGTALLLSALAPALARPAADAATRGLYAVALHATGSLTLGLVSGVAAGVAMRIVSGKPLVTMVLIVLTLTTWGAAVWLGLSPPTALFAAGVILANDVSRRDLVFTALKELDRPMTLALCVLAGARVAPVIAAATTASLLPALVFAAALPLLWRLTPAAWVGTLKTLPLSPLALTLVVVGGDTGLIGPAIIAAFITLEAASWLGPRTREADA